MIIAPFVLFRKKVNIYAYVISSMRTYMRRGIQFKYTITQNLDSLNNSHTHIYII